MPLKSKILALAAGVTLLAGTGAAALTAGSASASPPPLPPYPQTTTLDLGTPGCVVDDVILNDVTPALTVSDGSDGSPVVFEHATPPVHYFMWWLSPTVGPAPLPWKLSPPPGVQINPTTGLISAEGNGAPAIAGDQQPTAPTVLGTVTYTVRAHGKDAVGAVGTEQFQLTVNETLTSTSVSYEGNDFDNANGALTIQLNGGSTTSTTLTLSAIASSLNIPGSTPVTFALFGSNPGWHLSSIDVLTGVSASDPEFSATTANHDVVFFHLTGISTDSGGNFFVNNDTNPCVSTTPPPPPPPPSSGNTAACTTSYGNEVNPYGNGLDVFEQHAVSGNKIVGWPATQADPASHFLCSNSGGVLRFQYAPHGAGTGLCVSNPGNDLLVLRACNLNIWQQFTASGRFLISSFDGKFVVPGGTGVQLAASATHSPWGGDKYTWTPFASLP